MKGYRSRVNCKAFEGIQDWASVFIILGYLLVIYFPTVIDSQEGQNKTVLPVTIMATPPRRYCCCFAIKVY